jgi:hypothetical protein
MRRPVFTFALVLLLSFLGSAAGAAPGDRGSGAYPQGLPFRTLLERIEALEDRLGAATGDRVVAVDCDRGERIGDALETPARRLELQVSGTCVEDVEVRRGALRLVATGPGTELRGGLAVVGGTAGAAPAAGGIELVDLRIRAAATDGVRIDGGAVVRARGLDIAGSGRNGIDLRAGAVLDCTDCRAADNGDNGLRAFSSATLGLDGTATFSGNGANGLLVLTGAALELGVDTPATLDADDNGESGVNVSNGAHLFAGPDALVRAGGNALGPAFGAGLLVGTEASALVLGRIEVDSNAFGVAAIAGGLLLFGTVEASGNETGLFVRSDGILRLSPISGSNLVEDSTFGIAVQDGTFEAADTTVTGSSAVDLAFINGASVRYGGNVQADLVVCGPEALVFGSGGPACP